MKDLTKLNVGDKVLKYNTPTFLPIAITVFMKLYLNKLDKRFPGIKKIIRHVYHHTGTIVEMWGELCVAEATARGYVIQPLMQAYNQYDWDNRIDIMTWIKPLTDEQKEKVNKKAVKLAVLGTPYDVSNFWYQIKKVSKGFWQGPEGPMAENALYCSEGDAILCNEAEPGTYENAAEVNPIDSACCKSFRYYEPNPRFVWHEK